jgi:NAD(P)H-dependent flavin oxidoreductase YrpB (nitropropane dioxygenase family)
MGAGVSEWRLANAVARCGQLGVVAGTALDVILARRLQMGDPEGHTRRALAAFPFPEIAKRVLDRYFVEGGKAADKAFKSKPFADVSGVAAGRILVAVVAERDQVLGRRRDGRRLLRLVPTEAMEYGLPCVAFDCECGPSKIINDGQDGFLIKDGDIKYFSDALEKLITDRSLREKMGLNAKGNAKRFYPGSIMKKREKRFEGNPIHDN